MSTSLISSNVETAIVLVHVQNPKGSSFSWVKAHTVASSFLMVITEQWRHCGGHTRSTILIIYLARHGLAFQIRWAGTGDIVGSLNAMRALAYGNNLLYDVDNLDLLRRYIKDEAVDLDYLYEH
jgi:hypothetical protein